MVELSFPSKLLLPIRYFIGDPYFFAIRYSQRSCPHHGLLRIPVFIPVPQQALVLKTSCWPITWFIISLWFQVIHCKVLVSPNNRHTFQYGRRSLPIRVFRVCQMPAQAARLSLTESTSVQPFNPTSFPSSVCISSTPSSHQLN